MAHIALIAPTPRDPNGSRQTIFPCGGLPATQATVLAAGEPLGLRWQNMIAHPGHYRVSFAADENTFQQHVLLDNIPSPDQTGEQNQTVALPACGSCVLQLVQVNTSGRANTPSGYIEYVACADISTLAPSTGFEPGPVTTSTPATTTTGTTTTGTTTTGTIDANTNTATSSSDAAVDPKFEGQGCSAAASPWGGLVVAWLMRRRHRKTTP